jgi:hypothetical protein
MLTQPRFNLRPLVLAGACRLGLPVCRRVRREVGWGLLDAECGAVTGAGWGAQAVGDDQAFAVNAPLGAHVLGA